MSDNPGAPAQGKRPLRFPDGFLIGASTAGHQTEGNNTNSDWWEFEHRPGSPVHEPSGDACDSYHRYPEDIGLVAGFGLNAYRFSVEWPRLEPAEGMFSRAETAHYRRMLAACHEHGIVPVVTYNHFTLPLWLQRRGGFAADDFPQLFQRFCAHVTRTLGDLIGWAVTINEPEGAGDAGYVLGIHPPGRVGDRELAHRVADNVLTAHRLGVKAIHDHGSMPAGVSLALQDMQYEDGATPGKTEWELNALISERYIEAAQEDDFVGLQTYTRIRFGPEGERGPGLHPENKNGLVETDDTTQVGWEFYPEALDGTIRRVHRVSGGKPILLTENGIATTHDPKRVAFMDRALRAVHTCLADGIDVRGYLHWSLLDNYEWSGGFEPTFGLVAVDRQTFARRPKESAYWLGDVARSRCLPAEPVTWPPAA
ncbi:glycoside hydrolase family 1 protein [Amycolatopsis sp. lyj-109]|uniref:glycoside hydrolase family 1 protein n=1 Tax=Amycolatopsis sp. lyj-109 TaxID=2789287 RepID=UPI00397D3272